MPSISAPRITRILRCSALLTLPVSATAAEPGLSAIEFPQVPLDIAGELAEQARELGLLGLGPAGQKPCEPCPAGDEEPGDRPAALGGELQPGRSPVLAVPGPADQAPPLELLGLPRDRRGVNAQMLGQIGQPQARPASVQYIQACEAGLIDIDTRLCEQELVQPHAQWTIEVDIGDTQVCNLLHPGSGVIEDHEESSITKRHHTLFGQSMKEILDFIALQIVGLRRLSAL